MFALLAVFPARAQLDSLAHNLVDTIKSRLIDDEIPRKTFKDKFMYPHRWYVKQLLKPRVPEWDTNYIQSNKYKLTVAVPVSKKFYGFQLSDRGSGKSLLFSPNNYYYLGFNFSNIIVTFGFAPGIRFGAKPGRGHTFSRDFQMTLIGRRVITDINYQQYRGFYVYNTRELAAKLAEPAQYVVRPDVQVFSFGVNTLFVFNVRRYSLRGAFSFTDVQRRPAGSWLLGIYHAHNVFAASDSGFVGVFREGFSEKVQRIKTVSVITVGVNGGYGYTHVYRKIVSGVLVNVGAGGQKTNYKTLDEQGHSLELSLALKANVKLMMRYDNLRFFSGIMATYDNNYMINKSMLNCNSYLGKVLFFAGYRFNAKKNGEKVLKALGLIDYR